MHSCSSKDITLTFSCWNSQDFPPPWAFAFFIHACTAAYYTNSSMAPATPFNYLQRKRTLKHASKPTALAKITSRPYINPQITSTLFSKLPGEIRNHIFYYALLAYLDPTRPYSKHSYWYRPGFTHVRAISVNLLLTCRRVYLETHLLPLVHNEHVIWGVEKSRIPPGSMNYSLYDRHMTLSQRNAVQYVHLFTQQFWLEDWKNQWRDFTTSWPESGPERLRITIRHTDWWYNLLGENSPLALDPKRRGRARVGEWIPDDQPYESGSWGSRFENLPGLKIFEMELETIEAKRGQLDTIVEKARSWRFPSSDSNVLVMDEDEKVLESTWTGSKHFKGLNASNPPVGLQLRQGSTASFSPFKTAPRVDTDSEDLQPDDTHEYYVVLLTWRVQDHLRVPDNPPAAVITIPTSLEGTSTTAALTNTTVTSPRTAPRGTYNRLTAIPTYYG